MQLLKQIIAENLNLEYVPLGIGGLPNELIFSWILSKMNLYNDGDIIFINFSFFERGAYYDYYTKRIESTCHYYDDINKEFTLNNLIPNHTKLKTYLGKEIVADLVKYYVNNQEDYNKRLFNPINIFFKNLLFNKKIKIFYIFAGESDFQDELLKVGTQLKFSHGFSKWLMKNNLHNEENLHYSYGIQYIIANSICIKTNNLTETLNKISFENKDFDFDKIEQKNII